MTDFCLILLKNDYFSAGVGRSGTFIALDSLLEAAEHEDTLDALDFTYRMR